MQKDWKEQGHKNVLTKNTIEAMGWAYVSEYHTTISVELGVSTKFEVLWIQGCMIQVMILLSSRFWDTRPERIYNPIMAMGFSAMFTFQLDNTKM